MTYVPRGYSDIHRMFLQTMMSCRMLKYEEACVSFCKISQSVTGIEDEMTQTPRAKDMEKAITVINQVIKRFYMEIRLALDEYTSDRYYLLVNLVSNEITSKTFGRFTAAEMEFFKKVLFEIVCSENGYITSTECLNLNSVLPGNTTKSEVEILIDKFCRELWLCEKDGKIYLSLLGIVELEPLLSSVYKDYITTCLLCNHIVIQGYRCSECNILFHLYCVKHYCRRQMLVCPQCKADQPEMEAAVRHILSPDIDDDNFNTSNSASSSRKGKGVGKTSVRK
ncbi:non-structural maintenance of chromosomes element 1 homolog isoform X2 [Periplaneta americana]|uniref:non-structural maintenance of chromosomes element 1 homolog isoform X2 n=2 Tax=Periplaneta americana TaxID=6978 RepID=UPI0037E6FE6B